jgi:hypothetical protein
MAKKSRSRTTPANVPKVSVAPASPDGPNRKVRKEEARREREALQRKATRRKLYRWGVVGLAVVVVLVTVSLVVVNSNSSSPTTKPTPTVLQGMQQGNAPWGPGLVDLKQRLQAIGVPFGPQETLVYHIHDLVQVYINGQTIPIPAGIGINNVGTPSDQFIAALHTHDASGIVHIESPDKRDYTLGQFFDTWGVNLTSTCLGTPYCNAGDKQIRVFYDGKPYTQDPRGIVFSQHHDIVVTYGTEAQLPNPIPKRYSGSLSPSCAGPPASC